MGRDTATSLFEDMVVVYGQLGVQMAGCAAMARREIAAIDEAREREKEMATLR